MLTCKSPRKVMRAAYHLARQSLPQYSNKFSRHDFTLPQLFACLVAKETLKRSYRGIEAVLIDCDNWQADIGLSRTPDHNTLCRAAKALLSRFRVNRLLDQLATWADIAELLKLATHPLALDSTSFDSHHVSRHYERRCHQTRAKLKQRDAKRGRKTSRSLTVRRLPKLGIAVASAAHWILSLRASTGAGADQPDFEPLVLDAWRRVRARRFKVVADAGYDSESNHCIARQDMGLLSLIPPLHGRPLKRKGARLSGRWRRHMQHQLKTSARRKASGYTKRWQAETVNSMFKRNLGSALSGKTAHSRKRDMALKIITHNLMIFDQRVETEQVGSLFCDWGRRIRFRGATQTRVKVT